MLNRELPGIGEKCSMIVSGPHLLGVTELTSSSMGTMRNSGITLTNDTIIQEKDNYNVKLFLICELKLLFERNGIDLM